MTQRLDGRIRTTVGLLGLALLPTASVAQDAGGSASVSSGVSYSSLRGGLAFVSFDGKDILGSGIDVGLKLEKGEDGQAARLDLSKRFDLGQSFGGTDSYVAVSVAGASSDWASHQYALDHVEAQLRYGATMASGIDYETRLFWAEDNLKRFGPNASPLVLADQGKSSAAGLGLNLSYTTFDRQVLPTSGFGLGVDIAAASPLGDREWLSYSVKAGLAQPLGRNLTFALNAEAGQIRGLNGQTVRINDRAFLGGSAPRGFAAGGLGPRDYEGTPDGVNSPLGGNSYALASAELRMATANPNVVIGAFVDAGSLWDLDVVAGGASGVIDDSLHLRSSAGLSIYWSSPLGLVQLNLAAPIKKLDYDEAEYVSLGLGVTF